jgi:hypothetical protein
MRLFKFFEGRFRALFGLAWGWDGAEDLEMLPMQPTAQ